MLAVICSVHVSVVARCQILYSIKCLRFKVLSYCTTATDPFFEISPNELFLFLFLKLTCPHSSPYLHSSLTKMLGACFPVHFISKSTSRVEYGPNSHVRQMCHFKKYTSVLFRFIYMWLKNVLKSFSVNEI